MSGPQLTPTEPAPPSWGGRGGQRQESGPCPLETVKNLIGLHWEECRTGTYERDSVRWKRCRRPLNMTNELGGKERAATSQRGPSKAPPAGHWQRKPPWGASVQVPPLRQMPGTQRPASVSSSQSSPAGQRGQGCPAGPAAAHRPSARGSARPCPRRVHNRHQAPPLPPPA